MRSKYREIGIFCGVMVFAIALELALASLQVKDENIYLVFVLAILIIIIEERKIIYGLLASVISVLSLNFFITEPRFSFVVDDPNNYFSFVMFIVVTFMVDSLVIQLQRQISISRENEEKINSLYTLSSRLLHKQSNEEIFEMLIERFKENGDQVTLISGDKIYGAPLNIRDHDPIVSYVLKNDRIIADKDPIYRDLDYLVFPIKSPVNDYGTLFVRKDGADIDPLFIENIIEEIVVALDKNDIADQQEQTKVEVEKEKFKTSLLRGLSHDLKTPLTMIQSGSGFLDQSYEMIDDENRRQLIRDIYDESCDLSDFVSNLLDLTRLEDPKMALNMSVESVDDILFSVAQKLERRLGEFDLQIRHQDQLVLVEADVELLCQVFINLIDNAITHNPPGTKVIVDYVSYDDLIEFKVSDNGKGISADEQEKIFDDFYSLTSNEDKKRSHGLGLSICKAIVEAHGGHISVENNESGGAAFTFTIPKRKERFDGKDDPAGRR